MSSEFRSWTTIELVEQEALRVEDGNHGENRPRPNEFVEQGTSFIRAADVRGGGVDFAGADRINEVALERIRKGIGQPGDVLLTHKGTVGRVARVPADAPPFVCSPQTTFWRVLDEEVIDPEYLRGFMESPAFQEQLDSRMNESDMAAYVSLTAQRALRIDLPDIAEQRRVASMLSAVNEKLATCRKVAASAEAVAREFFAHWSESLPEADELPVSAIADFVNGRAFTKDATGAGRMVIRIAELKSGPSPATVYNEIDVAEKFLARPGTILFAWSGSLDVYRWFRDEGIINQHIFKVIPNEGIPDWFVFFQLQRLMPIFQGIAADQETTMGHIKRTHLDEYTVSSPSPEELEEASKTMEPLYELWLVQMLEGQTTNELRAALVPELIRRAAVSQNGQARAKQGVTTESPGDERGRTG